MTKYRKIAAMALGALVWGGATVVPAGAAGELDEAFRPRDISHIVELRSLEVPVFRVASAQAAPVMTQPQVAPENAQPDRKPGFDLWRSLKELFSS